MDSYRCQGCPFDGFPSFVLSNSGQMIVECPKCQRQDPGLHPSDFNKGVAAMHTDTSAGPGWGGKSAVVVQQNSAPAVSPPPMQRPQYAAPLPAPVAPAAPPARAPGDVLAWIEDRSAWLAAEEARLEGQIATERATLAGVRAERRRLEKMLRAGRERTPREDVSLPLPTMTSAEQAN